MTSQWKRGPLPKNTWGWGAVVPKSDRPLSTSSGFLFADFKGDHLVTGGGERIEPDGVALYNNSLEYPIPAEVIAEVNDEVTCDG